MNSQKIKIGSNKSFGIVFFVVFLIIGLYPLIYNDNPKIWSLIISAIFLFLGLINSKSLTPLNKVWFIFGIFLGKIVSPFVMGIIFFLVVTPIGFIMKILGKDSIQNHVIDTLVLAKNKFPGSPVSLDALCRRYRIDNSKREKHTALVDCDLLSKVYINLIDQKEPKLNFQSNHQTAEKDSGEKILYFKKVIKASTQEVEKHNQYLKDNLKKNFFN